MPAGTFSVDLPVSIDKVWEYVSNMDKWAPLVPGYIEHKILSDTQSTWSFKGDLGFMKKTVSLAIDITEWTEPSTVRFNAKGISDNFKGGGYFLAEQLEENKTRMTGNLDITAGGAMGPMVNSILKSFVPKTAEQLTTAVAEEVKRVNGVTV